MMSLIFIFSGRMLLIYTPACWAGAHALAGLRQAGQVGGQLHKDAIVLHAADDARHRFSRQVQLGVLAQVPSSSL